MARVMLISYPGYPSTLREFYPDNGLANLAASLLKEGHEARVLDFAAPSLLTWFFPHEYKEEMNRINEKMDESRAAKKKVSPELIKEFGEIDKKINNFQKKRICEFAYSGIVGRVREFKPDFTGFKLWIGEGFKFSIEIAKILRREFPGMKIFAGGPQVDWFDEYIYRFGFGEYFDVLACGEGEETIAALAEYAEGRKELSRVPNLIYRGNGGIIRTACKRVDNLENLSRPVYDSGVYFPMDKESKIRVFMIDESRGCPNKCAFCLHPHKSGDYWRTRGAEKVVDEMEYIIEKYDSNVFRFAGSNPPPQLKKDIAKEILRRKLKVRYGAFGHCRGYKDEDYHLLAESGCVALFFGVESGSTYILDKAMNKGNTKEQVLGSLLACGKYGIKAIASIIIPAPFDTQQTMDETFKLLKEAAPASVIVNPPGMLPHTDWFNRMDHYGFRLDDREESIKKGMVYTIKNFYPAELWDPPPIADLGSMSYAEVLKTTALFTMKLNRAGIATRITDDLSVLLSVIEEEPGAFMNRTFGYISGGDEKGIMKEIKMINEKISLTAGGDCG